MEHRVAVVHSEQRFLGVEVAELLDPGLDTVVWREVGGLA